MQGYFKDPEATRAVLSEDGWFSTGDIGFLDKDNYLFITDRKKDLLKTAAGKYVAPQPIENMLKTSPYILNAMVVGDQRKFVVALIVPNPATVSAKLAEQGLKFASDAELASHPRSYALIDEEVRRLTTHLASYETIKRFALLPDDFTFDSGSLTFTMKLETPRRRKAVHGLIDELFSDVFEPRPVTPRLTSLPSIVHLPSSTAPRLVIPTGGPRPLRAAVEGSLCRFSLLLFAPPFFSVPSVFFSL